MSSKKKNNTGPQGPMGPQGGLSSPSSARAQEFRREMADTEYDEDEVEREAYERTLQDLANRSKVGSGDSGLNSYRNYLKKMLKSSMSNYNDLLSRLKSQRKEAGSTIDLSMGQLSNLLQSQANPYDNFQAQQPQVTSQLQQLLESQNVSGSPVQDLASALNVQNQGQASAFSNLVGALGSNWQQGLQGQLQDVEAQRGQLMRGLDMNQLALIMGLSRDKENRQQQLMKMMLQVMGE